MAHRPSPALTNNRHGPERQRRATLVDGGPQGKPSRPPRLVAARFAAPTVLNEEGFGGGGARPRSVQHQPPVCRRPHNAGHRGLHRSSSSGRLLARLANQGQAARRSAQHADRVTPLYRAGHACVRPHCLRDPAGPDGRLTTSCMVSRGPSSTCPGPLRSRGGAGRESSRRAVRLIRSWGSFLAGDQPGDRGQHRVEMLASAEVTR